MARVQVSTAPSRAMYEQVSKLMDLEARRPDGLILHVAAETPSGEVQIVSVYESAEALQAFGEQRLFPAFAAAGVPEEIMAGPPPADYETFVLIT